MHRVPSQQGSDPPSPSPRLSRVHSQASQRERPALTSYNTLPAPPHLTPEPAYIASSAAAHVVSSGLANRGRAFQTEEDFDEDRAASVSNPALFLLNSFLDQLLYSFLASSRSTSILSLKPAIAEILKPRLAKEAIDGADEELRGYMAGGDDEELLDFHNGQELKGGSNLHHIFRRTRLRCMVYTRLGDLEEDDEEAYLESDTPQDKGQNRLSRDFGNVSPAAAIFLTSIIEFIGEQALMIAGENAASRFSSSRQVDGDRLLVEAHDVEKIAFNKTLGRLWRSWKKAGRTTSMIGPRPPLSEIRTRKTVSEGASRATSISEPSDPGYFNERLRRQGSAEEGDVRAGRNRLPQLHDLPDEPDFGSPEDKLSERTPTRERPHSMIDFEFPKREFKHHSDNVDPDIQQQSYRPVSKRDHRQRRASSLPPAKTPPYSSPTEEAFSTPTEEPQASVAEGKAKHKQAKTSGQTGEDSDQVPQLASHTRGLSNISEGALKRNAKPIPIDPSLPSREVSMSEYSDHSYANDAEMTPQALNFKKGSSRANQGTFYNESRPSTKTSSYSFHVGQQSPRASSEDPREEPAQTDDDTESGVLPVRGAPMEQSPVQKGDLSKLASVKGEPLKTYDDSGKNVKRDIPVVYEAASNEDVVYIPNNSPPQPQATINNSSDIAFGDPNGFEAIENQSQLGSTQRRDVGKPPTSAPTSSSPTSAHGSDKAAVQRIHHAARVSSSSNRDPRPATAGSSVSQVSSKIKGMMNRDSGDAVRQAVPRGTSSEVTREITGGSSRSGKSSDKEQDFEQLIRSDETIQYTLTPQNMREMEVREEPDQPRYSNKPPSTTSPIRSSTDKSPTTSRPAKPLKGMNGLRANPTQGSDVVEFASPSNAPPAGARVQTQQTSKAPSQKQGQVARGAQQRSDSMKDFADFIRSTGPDGDPRNLAKQSAERPDIARITSDASQASATKSSRKITKQQPIVSSKKSEPNLPTRGGSKLKARDPIAQPTNTTAELAEFFRSGPPSTQAAQRSVSSPMVNGKTRDGVGSGASVASTQDSFAASKITQSSTNSRTALLDSTNRMAVKSNAQRSQEPGGPVRKQRRVKDPYALDSDEEDEIVILPEVEPSEEETLSDFLKNYSPPSTAKADQQQHQLPPRGPSGASAPPQPQQSQPDTSPTKRKASGVSMRERIARNIAVIPDYRPIPPKAPKKTNNASPHHSPPSSNEKRVPNSSTTTNRSKPQPQPQPQPTAPQLPPLKSVSNASPTNPRAASPHLTQNGTKLDSLRPSQPTYSATRAGAAGKPKMVARAENNAASAGGMADLANFLRDTEPPMTGGPIGGGPMPGGKAAKMMGGAAGPVGVNGGAGRSMSPASGSGVEGGKWRMWGKKR